MKRHATDAEGAIIVETRTLRCDHSITHAVEVDESHKPRRVLCGSVPIEEIGPLSIFGPPTCISCVRIDALPPACPRSSPRWLALELRRLSAEATKRGHGRSSA
jgi:hypothetical protein